MSLKSKLSMYEGMLLLPKGHGYWHKLCGNPCLCIQKVLSGISSEVQCSSSSGTIWKSSLSLELLEYTGVLSGSWSLSELKDRHLCTGLGVVCGILWGVMVTVLQGVVLTGLKEACSMLETWCMWGVFCNGVGKSMVSEPLL